MDLQLSRTQKKELKKLRKAANRVWQSQQELASEAGDVARDATRQLSQFGRKQVVPRLEDAYSDTVGPYVDRGVKASRRFLDSQVAPTVGSVRKTSRRAWNIASDAGTKVSQGRFADLKPKKKRSKIGPTIAIVVGVTAAAAVLYAAWQTLRADDELWVADDPLAAPDA